MPYGIIKINRAKCLKCNDILVSEDEHPVTCMCGNLTIFGGTEMLARRAKEKDSYQELSIFNYDSLPEDIE